MDLTFMSDEEIVRLAKNDDAAMEFLFKKYAGIVKKESRTLYIIGADNEDLSQEGMIGLYKAIKSYDPSKGANFNTFATICVRGQIKTAITYMQRKKHVFLNSYVSFFEDYENSGKLVDVLEDKEINNPEEIVLAEENNKELALKIKNKLSKFEKNVLSSYLYGLSYFDIGIKLGKSDKSIDNALQRIRQKLSK